MLKDNKYMVVEATFDLLKEDKMIIQKSMSAHIFVFLNYYILNKVLVEDIHTSRCISLVQDVSLYG